MLQSIVGILQRMMQTTWFSKCYSRVNILTKISSFACLLVRHLTNEREADWQGMERGRLPPSLVQLQ